MDVTYKIAQTDRHSHTHTLRYSYVSLTHTHKHTLQKHISNISTHTRPRQHCINLTSHAHTETSYVKFPLRSNAILNLENNDKYCFIWSILASLHPCENDHPNRVSNYSQYFNELNFQFFDFTNGFKCSDVHKFNELNNLSVNIYELNFYQDGDKKKHNLIFKEISKTEADKVIDLLIYENHYALIKKVHVFLGDHNKSFVCRRCLNSYTNENVLLNRKEKGGDDNICTIRTSNDSHLYWKKTFS